MTTSVANTDGDDVEFAQTVTTDQPRELSDDCLEHVGVYTLDSCWQSGVSPICWEWKRLFSHDSDARITQHPDYVLQELALTSENQTQSASQTNGYLVGVGGDAARDLVGAGILVPKKIPILRTERTGLRWELCGYRLVGNRLIGQQDERIQTRLLKSIVDHVKRSGADFLLVEDLEKESPLHTLINAQTSSDFRLFAPSGFQERLRIQFPDNADAYWAKFSSKTRNGFRRKTKKFGDTELVRVTEPSQIADFLEQAHQVSVNSWQSRQLGLRVKNSDAEVELLKVLAIHEALRCYLLLRQDRPVAFLIGTQFNGYYNYEEVGYDREFARYSPGLVLLLKAIQDLLETRTPEWFDFGGGDAGYKQLFATHSSQSGNVWLMPSTFRTLQTIRILRTGQAISRAGRWLLDSTGLMTKVRQWSRHDRRGK